MPPRGSPGMVMAPGQRPFMHQMYQQPGLRPYPALPTGQTPPRPLPGMPYPGMLPSPLPAASPVPGTGSYSGLSPSPQSTPQPTPQGMAPPTGLGLSRRFVSAASLIHNILHTSHASPPFAQYTTGSLSLTLACAASIIL